MQKEPDPVEASRMARAIAFYTGNAYKPDCWSDGWSAVLDRIREAKGTPESFVFFLLRVMPGKNAGLLSMPRMLMQFRIWEQYREHMLGQNQFCRTVFQNQTTRIESLFSHGVSYFNTLMNESECINPALRMELALEKLTGDEQKQVLQKWIDQAQYFLVGVQAFHKYVPNVLEYMKQNKKDVTI